MGRSDLPKRVAPSSSDWPKLSESKIKLDIPANPHGDNDGDSYTNLEGWLHEKARIVEGKVDGELISPTGLKKE